MPRNGTIEDVLVDWSSPIIKPGDTYGRLTVLSTHKIFNTYRYMVKCQCSCKSDPIYVRFDALRVRDGKSRKPTRSCGCFHKEQVTTHGAWNHPIFHLWSGMMSRCYDPKDKRYEDYGGRNITVCEEWKHNPNNFIQDMFPTYQKGLQIDRTDNSKEYSPKNCRWATRSEQGRNKRNNVLLTLNGETHCLAEWAEITGVCFGTLWDRSKVRGWSDEKVLTTPVMTTAESTRLARKAQYRKPQ